MRTLKLLSASFIVKAFSGKFPNENDRQTTASQSDIENLFQSESINSSNTSNKIRIEQRSVDTRRKI